MMKPTIIPLASPARREASGSKCETAKRQARYHSLLRPNAHRGEIVLLKRRRNEATMRLQIEIMRHGASGADSTSRTSRLPVSAALAQRRISAILPPVTRAKGKAAPARDAERGMRASEDIVQLMGRVARRDRKAFAELYRATSAKMFGTALRILRQRDLAEDIVQEVYAKIWERAGDFDAAKASPITWMATIVRNRALDEVRRKAPLKIEDMPEGFEPAAEPSDPLAGRDRSEGLRRLLACLDKLDPQKRQMVLLAYYNGASRDALAQRYEAPVPTIKTWLHRSLAQLRACLSS
jgi:RNA polymerase sigma-70 factor (ECF subfamily)